MFDIIRNPTNITTNASSIIEISERLIDLCGFEYITKTPLCFDFSEDFRMLHNSLYSIDLQPNIVANLYKVQAYEPEFQFILTMSVTPP